MHQGQTQKTILELYSR